jgi:hypothetical protein
MTLNNEALEPAQYQPYRQHIDFDPWPLLQLQILFEQLILAPIPKTKRDDNKGLNSIIHSRLRRFKQGKIRELYEEAHQIQSKTPKQQAKKPVQIQKAAQSAADVDNFKSANARVTKHAPVALINQDNIHVLEKLHPPSLRFKATPTQVVKTLSHLNRGKATGLNCDSLDLYINAGRRLNLHDVADLAKANLLPFNYAIGVGGGIDVVIKTI